jgi:hypothetical protein
VPTWSEILEELKQSCEQGGGPQLDAIRRKYLVSVAQHTGRDVILYATKWTQPDPNLVPDLVSIVDEDVQGIMEVIHGLCGPDLDLILHSPGGSLEAAEALVTYLRSKFQHIRVIVPSMAMSAATMIACAADVIVLGKHSFLGPIDPQISIHTPLGPRMVPAQAILDQFELAKKECQDPAKLGAWLPMLSQYGPDILVQCTDASSLSEQIVKEWLARFMFRDEAGGRRKARKIAKWLADHRRFKTHGRHIPRTELEAKGLRIEHLEDDQDAQDLFLSVFHATTHTFNMTPAAKIIENHLGKAFIKQFRAVLMQVPGPQGGVPPGFPAPPQVLPPGSPDEVGGKSSSAPSQTGAGRSD